MIELGLYKHFKGKFYRVIMTATDAETEQQIIIYVPLYGNGRVSARTESNFFEHINRNEYAGPRFIKVDDEDVQ